MGLEEILSKIRTETEAEYSKTIADANAEADKIILEAKKNSDSLLKERKNQSEKELQDEKLRSIASARLESKRKELEAREEILKRYENEALHYLQEFAQSADYKDFLLRMVKDGVSKIGSGSIVSVNAADKKILANSKSVDFQISPEPIGCMGGAIISSKDGKKRVDNTLESIFEDRKEDLRLKLAEQMFDYKG